MPSKRTVIGWCLISYIAGFFSPMIAFLIGVPVLLVCWWQGKEKAKKKISGKVDDL